ncbi:hypothetical protein GCM10009804_34490 [Kribbella hippodromi]|uniref:Uncharacterized protein n=1 Tax=Kribbella hippodromi TaxID=434347 RepID=A0ABN2DFF8_9ACTN
MGAMKKVDDPRDERSMDAAKEGLGVTLRLAFLRRVDPAVQPPDADQPAPRRPRRKLVVGLSLTALSAGAALKWHTVAIWLQNFPW